MFYSVIIIGGGMRIHYVACIHMFLQLKHLQILVLVQFSQILKSYCLSQYHFSVCLFLSLNWIIRWFSLDIMYPSDVTISSHLLIYAKHTLLLFFILFHPTYALVKCGLISGTYIDKKCPFTGTVSIRGRILAGTCHSAKMMRTIVVRRNYLHWVKKYQRYRYSS